MPKWLLYAVAALAEFVIAVIAYRTERVVSSVVLVLAGICFTIAAIGSARGAASR